jgi:hypothetical protein
MIIIIHKDSQTTSRIEEAPSRKHFSFRNVQEYT